MTKKIKRQKLANRIASTFLSLGMVVCLMFSSLSVYTTEVIFSDNSNEIEFSSAQLEQGYIHHTKVDINDFLAEVVDVEEEDNFILKKETTSYNTIIRILWTYSLVEEDNLSAVEYAEVPVTKISEPYYIEFCSLKIPS
ncbi:MAG: hypothetical protein H6587_03095 [Flavobacteriales bacterium]|nr:hypothetical protein [Flavobacteriales bacterium]MCB9363534.1 hypothetical protein [Flavobacteriales bacterium]